MADIDQHSDQYSGRPFTPEWQKPLARRAVARRAGGQEYLDLVDMLGIAEEPATAVVEGRR